MLYKTHSPAVQPPFRCYICCHDVINPTIDIPHNWNKNVIGEFICDSYTILNDGNVVDVARKACLPEEFLEGRRGKAWSISKVKFYNRPRSINDFFYFSEVLKRPEIVPTCRIPWHQVCFKI